MSSHFDSKLPSSEHVELFGASAPQIKPVENKTIYTINDLLVQRARSMPDVRLLAYPATARGVDDYLHYTARDLDRFADEAAKKYIDMGITPKVC